MFNLFNFNKVRSSVTREDLKISRYFCIYDYHSKKAFRVHLEKATLEKTNEIINFSFPKRIKKDDKREILNCIVIFLKFMSINYTRWDEYEFKKEFDRIVRKNIEKLLD